MSHSASHADLEPSGWIARHAALVAPNARVLDVAAGHGRHALFFAARDARVLAVDHDANALSALRGQAGIDTIVADLERGTWPFAGERFDAIVVVNYLHRPLFEHLLLALAPDGVLLYETFAAGNEAFGRPARREFLLRAGELLELVRGRLTIVGFEQGMVRRDDGTAVVQRLAAVGSSRQWPPLLG